ncbi:hypothetical protein CRG98_016907 [Punica granatum]|uniref:Uncharacterized protein n=1 Tax=Punica granatum TaxID=22663 RepID=A0A2I0K4K6_PUNGR|nr:hypothetical protein CRG98_016907 [Punica granatum]
MEKKVWPVSKTGTKGREFGQALGLADIGTGASCLAKRREQLKWYPLVVLRTEGIIGAVRRWEGWQERSEWGIFRLNSQSRQLKDFRKIDTPPVGPINYTQAEIFCAGYCRSMRPNSAPHNGGRGLSSGAYNETQLS